MATPETGIKTIKAYKETAYKFQCNNWPYFVANNWVAPTTSYRDSSFVVFILTFWMALRCHVFAPRSLMQRGSGEVG